jgi:hypothetical protein
MSYSQIDGTEYDADDDHAETEFVVEALADLIYKPGKAISFVHPSAGYSGRHS